MNCFQKICVLILTCIFVTGCSNPSTPAGNEGYVRENPRAFGKGGFVGVLKGPANFGLSPFRKEVENVDFRPTTYSESFNILTQDELNISLRWQTIIKIKPNSIKNVVEDYAGNDFYARFIKEPLRSMVRKNVQPLNSREVKEKRDEIAMAVSKELTAYLDNTPFIVISGVVGNIDYPAVVTQAAR